MANIPLDERFKRFIAHLPGSIDMDGADGLDLLRIPVKRCDYYLNTPETAVSLSFFEQKTLTDAEFTPDEVAFARNLNQAVVSAGGKLDPDLSRFDPALVAKLTKRLDRVVENANRQLRHSACLMRLPVGAYNGFLVILNDVVEMLGHDVLVHLCDVALRKRRQDGEIRYPEINGVIIIDETQRLANCMQGIAVYKPSHLSQRGDADRVGLEIASLWSEIAPTDGAALATSTSFLRNDWGITAYTVAILNSISRVVGNRAMLIRSIRQRVVIQ